MIMQPWHEDPTHLFRIASTDGSFAAYQARPSHSAGSVIIVLHEVFGVNADLRATCDELAASGFIAICPELFWRREAHVDLSIRSQADWEKGLDLYNTFDLDAGVRDVKATIAAVRTLPGASGRVGVMGFCLGGLLTFLAAARSRFDAAVAFHGGRTEEFLDETRDIDTPLQMHLAAEDEFITKQAQQEITAALASNAQCELFSYAGCNHAFSRHDGMHFDAAAARLSRARTLDFFHRHLV
jgi:carboxymethylenebutenolidase